MEEHVIASQLRNSNLYSRRGFLGLLVSASASTFLAGCGGKTLISSVATPAAVLKNPQPVPTGVLSSVTVQISSTVINQISPRFLGLSYEKSALSSPLFSPSNAELVELFKLLGPGVLRVGGNSVDKTVWNPEGTGQVAGQVAPADIDNLAAFLNEVGWQCIYGVNLGGAASGVTTPALAAAEVAYASQSFGSALAGVEIGNECEYYGAAGSYFAGNWSLDQFIALWQDFRQAIVETTPGVTVAGPASATNPSAWAIPFGDAVAGNNIALLTQHYYRGNGSSPSATASNLLSPDANLASCLAAMNGCATSLRVPYRMAECNSYYNGGASGVSNAYASTLWAIDFLFQCAHGGSAGVNLHGGGHAAYTPISDSAGTALEVHPEFYGALLFRLAGEGALVSTSISGNANATAYAIRSATGATNLVIVNKDATQDLDITVQMPDYANTGSVLLLTQSSGGSSPDLAATSGITIQGNTISTNGTFAPGSSFDLPVKSGSVSCYVPALSAALVQIS